MGQIREAKARIEALNAKLAFQKSQMKSTIKYGLIDLDTAYYKIDVYKKSLSAAQLNYNFVKTKFENGESSSVDLEEAEQLLEEQNSNYENAIYSYLIKIARFGKLLGSKLMKKIKLNIILAIILFIILIFRISTKDGTQDFIFSTTDVVNGDIVESVVSSGKIIPGEEIKVFSRVTGDIYQTYVEYGDIVKKGQILIELDSSTYENNLKYKAKNLEILEIEQDQMRKKVDTDTKLLDGGYIPKVELEESENQYRIKSIEIDELNSEINLQKQKISDTKLTSPIDGRIDYLNEDLIKEGKIFNASWVYTISSAIRI